MSRGRLVLSLCFFVMILGCNNSSNDKKEASDLKPGEVFSKHNASSCPLNLVGVYQRIHESGTAMKQDLMKIYLQTSQILTAVPVVNGVEVPAETLYVDGVKRQPPNAGPENYRISYCENFMIVSIGQASGRVFRTELRGSGNIMTFSRADDVGNMLSIKYQKIKAADYFLGKSH